MGQGPKTCKFNKKNKSASCSNTSCNKQYVVHHLFDSQEGAIPETISTGAEKRCPKSYFSISHSLWASYFSFCWERMLFYFIPVALLARECQVLYRIKSKVGKETPTKEERGQTLVRWQTSWEQGLRGRWMARLLSKDKPWVDREHSKVGYYLIQFLSLHEYFWSYLHKMQKALTAQCLYCPVVNDNVEYTFFACDRWLHRQKGWR